MNKLTNKIRQKLGRSKNFNRATEKDVYYCYRLLLNREPDDAGWRYWQDLVNNHHISLQTLCDGFLNAHEFRNLVEERNKPQLIDLPTFKMYVRLNDHFIGATIAQTKEYEPYVINELKQWLKPGDTFVDVGANIGYFTLFAAARVGEKGRVISFEPRPDNCQLLKKSIAENGFDNISIYQNAVAEKAQTLIFSGGGADSNGRIINENEPMAKEHQLPVVEAITLDETLAAEPQINIIKLDIEGAEPRAWLGMQQIVEKHHPILFMEFSPSFIQQTSQTDPAAFMDSMQKQYAVYILERSGKRSSQPLNTSELIQAQADSGLEHLDIVAVPRT
ncbi:MAG: FkbM family methyltransferase [Ardenticatenaceae bacterium]|nr:FkbM family methyltransferase [Ardenticatenaceae bacterium]